MLARDGFAAAEAAKAASGVAAEVCRKVLREDGFAMAYEWQCIRRLAELQDHVHGDGRGRRSGF